MLLIGKIPHRFEIVSEDKEIVLVKIYSPSFVKSISLYVEGIGNLIAYSTER